MTRFRFAEVTIDCHDPERVAAFWAALFGVRTRVPQQGWRRLGPLTEGGPLINFQPVPEAKAGKARIHLDLLIDDIDEAVAEVCRLGGRSLDERRDYDEGSVLVMADPEGNEFCMVRLAPGAQLD